MSGAYSLRRRLLGWLLISTAVIGVVDPPAGPAPKVSLVTDTEPEPANRREPVLAE